MALTAGTSRNRHPYRQDMSGVDWARMFQHQAQRLDQATEWLRAMNLRPGDRCIDMGCGPGFFSLLLAERVGPQGLVYAIDRLPEPLAYLEREQRARDVPQIRRIQADGEKADVPDGPVDAALVAMMLHHAHDPGALLRNVARLLRRGGRAVVAEFHPDGTGEYGPPLPRRLAPGTIHTWCEAAGFTVLAEERQTPEHYVIVCARG